MKPVSASVGEQPAAAESESDSGDDSLQEVVAIMKAREKKSERLMRRYDEQFKKLEERVAQLEEQLRRVTPSADVSTPSNTQDEIEDPEKVSINSSGAPNQDPKASECGVSTSAGTRTEPISAAINTQSWDDFSNHPSENSIDILPSEHDGPGTVPNRIRFNSLLLIIAIKRFIGVKASTHQAISKQGWVMDRPFKALVEKESFIRKKSNAFRNYLERHRRADAQTLNSHGQARTGVETIPDQATTDVLDANAWQAILIDFDMYCCEECTQVITSESPTISLTRSLFDVFETLLESQITGVTQRYRDRSIKSSRFSNLWYLFQPGDVVVTLRGRISQYSLALKVFRTHGGREHLSGDTWKFLSSEQDEHRRLNNFSPFFIDGYYLDFDGETLTPVRRRFIIEPYPGEKNISELSIFPIEYSHTHTRQNLSKRGMKFLSLCLPRSGAQMRSNGLNLDGEDMNDSVIVDMQEYLRLNKSETPAFVPPKKMGLAEINDYMAIETGIREEARRLSRCGFDVTEDEFVLCHYRLHVYRLSSRTWVKVHVDTLSEVDPTIPSGFDLLVLPEGHKETLITQIQDHILRNRSKSSLNLDLVQGKGQGLIILLHGVPGVGKSSTAECVAEYIRKPLYPITCGALGETATEIETRLNHHLALARRWDCVVLLDEADLFLARRSRDSYTTNSIVVLFLRVLDYYSGILIMTTNRVGIIDEGFISRIHLSLYYPELSNDMRERIFKNFLDRTEEMIGSEGGKNITVNTFAIIRFLRKSHSMGTGEWNGRRIRNAFQTAIAMAEYKARRSRWDKNMELDVDIGVEEFEYITNSVQSFDHYLSQTIGGTAEQRAFREQLRGGKYADKQKYEGSNRSRREPVDDSD